jgi:signal peptidase II
MFLSIAILLFLDQASKIMMVNYLGLQNSVNITSFLQFIIVYNKGVSFSFLSGVDYRFILILSFVSMVVATLMIGSFFNKVNNEFVISLALIIAGSLGNFIDRLLYGYVVDFIHVYYLQYSFPVFNLSDCFITLCAIILLKNILIKK